MLMHEAVKWDVTFTAAGSHNDLQSERGRPEHVPRRNHCQHARLLQRSLLRRSQRPRLTDWKHPGCVLVGHHHHDNGRLRRQGSERRSGPPHWSGMRHLRYPDSGYTRADHRGSFQSILLASNWSISTTDRQLIGRSLSFMHSLLTLATLFRTWSMLSLRCMIVYFCVCILSPYYFLYVFYICCLCLINGWMDGWIIARYYTEAFKVMTVFLMLPFFLVNKGLCAFYTVKCVIPQNAPQNLVFWWSASVRSRWGVYSIPPDPALD